MTDKKQGARKRVPGPRTASTSNRHERDRGQDTEMRTARLVHLDGRVENKKFAGAPKQQLFSYRKGEHGNIIGRHYFDLDPEQDPQSTTVNYTEVAAPKPQ